MAQGNYGGYGTATKDQDKIKEAQSQVDEVIDVMRSNVTKVMEREGKLSEIDKRSEALEQSAITFTTASKRLRKKYWWENLKMKLILGGVLVTILIIIIVVIVVETKKSDPVVTPTSQPAPN